MLAKTQNLSHKPAEDSENESEFSAFVTQVESKPGDFPFAVPRFESTEGLWESLKSDPLFQAEFERRMEEKTQAMIKENFGEIQARVEKEAQENGYQAGYQMGSASGKKAFEEASQRLERACAAVLKEKQSLLREHEKRWMQGMVHLLRRFRVPKHATVGREIQQWLDEAVSDFPNRAKVKIFLSPDEYSATVSGLNGTVPNTWEVYSRTGLQSGECICEVGDGGIDFTNEPQLARLEALIQRATSPDGME